MVEKLKEFQTLTRKGKKTDPKLAALKVEQAQVQAEIEKLIDSLTGASEILISYANEKIAALDAKRQDLTKRIADVTAQQSTPAEIAKISDYLDKWENISFNDKRVVLDGLITAVRATSMNDSIEIEWKI